MTGFWERDRARGPIVNGVSACFAHLNGAGQRFCSHRTARGPAKSTGQMRARGRVMEVDRVFNTQSIRVIHIGLLIMAHVLGVE